MLILPGRCWKGFVLVLVFLLFFLNNLIVEKQLDILLIFCNNSPQSVVFIVFTPRFTDPFTQGLGPSGGARPSHG